jgi:hypothetical protein
MAQISDVFREGFRGRMARQNGEEAVGKSILRTEIIGMFGIGFSDVG